MKGAISVFAVICGMALVTSTPVQPIRGLEEVDPVDACLFLCNLCFDDNAEVMMKCANRVCLSEYMVTEYSLFVIKQLCPVKENNMEKFFANGVKH